MVQVKAFPENDGRDSTVPNYPLQGGVSHAGEDEIVTRVRKGLEVVEKIPV
jgi:hypothetical protein